MKHLLPIVAIAGMLAASAASAALPACWPTASDTRWHGVLKSGSTADGKWAAWSCSASGPRYWIAARTGYALVMSKTTGLSVPQTAEAYWLANVRPVSAANLPAMTRLRKVALASLGPRP